MGLSGNDVRRAMDSSPKELLSVQGIAQIFVGDPDARVPKDLRALFLARLTVEQIKAVHRANVPLTVYTIFTAMIAVATVVTVIF
jgi:hypothetical protein